MTDTDGIDIEEIVAALRIVARAKTNVAGEPEAATAAFKMIRTIESELHRWGIAIEEDLIACGHWADYRAEKERKAEADQPGNHAERKRSTPRS
jgi:hypothetical protein